MTAPEFLSHPSYREYPVDEMERRAAECYADVRRRRTVRDFSARPALRRAAPTGSPGTSSRSAMRQ